MKKRMKVLQRWGQNKLNQFQQTCIKSIKQFITDEENTDAIVDMILLYSNHHNVLTSFQNEPILLYLLSYNYKNGVEINDIVKFEKIIQSTFSMPDTLRLKLLLGDCTNFNLYCDSEFEHLYAFNKWKINNDYISISPYITVNLQLNKYKNIQTQIEYDIDIEEILFPVNDWHDTISYLIKQYEIGYSYKDINDFMYNFMDKHIQKLNYGHAEFFYLMFILKIYNLKYKLLVNGFCRQNAFHRYASLDDNIFNIILHLYPFFIMNSDNFP